MNPEVVKNASSSLEPNHSFFTTLLLVPGGPISTHYDSRRYTQGSLVSFIEGKNNSVH